MKASAGRSTMSCQFKSAKRRAAAVKAQLTDA